MCTETLAWTCFQTNMQLNYTMCTAKCLIPFLIIQLVLTVLAVWGGEQQAFLSLLVCDPPIALGNLTNLSKQIHRQFILFETITCPVLSPGLELMGLTQREFQTHAGGPQLISLEACCIWEAL